MAGVNITDTLEVADVREMSKMTDISRRIVIYCTGGKGNPMKVTVTKRETE